MDRTAAERKIAALQPAAGGESCEQDSFSKPEVRSVCFFNFPHFLYLMIAPCAQNSGQAQNGHGDDEPFSGEVGEQEEGGHVGADMEQDTGMERTVLFGGVGQKKSHAEAIKALGDIAVEQAEGSGA